MKEIIGELKGYIRANYDGRLYLALALLAAIALYVNYTWDVEDGMIDRLDQPYRFLAMLLFHTIPYVLVCLLLLAFGKSPKWYRHGGFWLRLFIGFSILSLDRTLSIDAMLRPFVDGADLAYSIRLANKAKSLVTMVIPLVLLSLVLEKNNDGKFYGLKASHFDFRPYFILLGLAGIAICIGGFFRDIQEFYPRYLEVGGPQFAKSHDFPGWINMLIYEFTYGTDFISVELFFRGFLIIGMVRFLGPGVVLPMILTYCFLHFGKPLTESVSSLFGGYILGILSLNSKSIWGGIMIHVGIAWLMELVGYLFRL